MQKPNLTKICRSVKTATVKHSPEILTGVGIAGMVTGSAALSMAENGCTSYS